MSPETFWWLLDAHKPVKTWGHKYKYTEAQMEQMYQEMLVQHEEIYGRSD